MKGKLVLSVVMLMLPLSLAGQVAKPTGSDTAVDFDRYEVYAAAAYSSANQAKGSSALIGGNVGADMKFKKWFGAAVDFGYYGSSSGTVTPTVTTFLAGPEAYIPADNLYGILPCTVWRRSHGRHRGQAGCFVCDGSGWRV